MNQDNQDYQNRQQKVSHEVASWLLDRAISSIRLSGAEWRTMRINKFTIKTLRTAATSAASLYLTKNKFLYQRGTASQTRLVHDRWLSLLRDEFIDAVDCFEEKQEAGKGGSL